MLLKTGQRFRTTDVCNSIHTYELIGLNVSDKSEKRPIIIRDINTSSLLHVDYNWLKQRGIEILR